MECDRAGNYEKEPVKEDGNFYIVKVVTTAKQGGREDGN